MAKQRINPEGAPERIMQPVASPVDMFYRAEPDGFLKLAQGLSSLAPGLANVSNSIIEVIAKREAVEGSIEGDRLAAMPDSEDGLATVKQPKIAKAIEDSGGISPWRAQSLLESFGRNTVLQQYTRRIEEEFEDLSNPLGPDGQLRPADYAQRRMAEIFTATSAAIPQNSYYARKAAEATRAEVDPVVLYKIGQAYVKKTKEEHVRAYVNQAVDVLEAGDYAAFQKAIPAIANKYRQETGQSGDDLITAALVTHAKMKARSGGFGATALLQEALDEGINGRPLGATVRAQLEEAIDAVSNIEEAGLRNEAQRKSAAVSDAFDLVLQKLESMPQDQWPNGRDEIAEMTDSVMDGMGLSNDMKSKIRGTMLKETREHLIAMRKGELELGALTSDPVYEEDLRRRLEQTPSNLRREVLNTEFRSGRINPSQYRSLAEYARGLNEMTQATGMYLQTVVNSSVENGKWTGMTMDQIAPSFRPEVERIQGELTSAIAEAAMRFSREFASEPDPILKERKIREALAKETSRLVGEARTQNKSIIERGDRAGYFNNVLRKEAEFEAEKTSRRIAAEMGLAETSLDGSPVIAYVNVTEAVNQAYIEEASRWYEAQMDRGSTPDEVLRDWQKGKREVFAKVKEMFQDPKLLEGQPAEVRASIPRPYLSTQRTVREGVSQSGIPQAAGAGLSDLGGISQVPQTVPWHVRWFNSKTDFVGGLDAAREAAAKAMTQNTPETRRELDDRLVEVHRRADALFSGVRSDKSVRFTEAGIERFQWIDEDNLLNRTLVILNGQQPRGRLGFLMDTEATTAYWAMKAMKGLDAQERGSGRTADGLRIDDAKWNPDSMLLFSGRQDLTDAVRSGEIDQVLVRVTQAGFDMTREELIEKQMKLIAGRIPQSIDQTTSTETGNQQ